jgi:hypothetical protein
MRFTVVWLPSALNELAALWVRSADRQAVSDAANRIDQALRRDPANKGRAYQGFRVLVELPLAAAFQVLPDDCLVRVVRVVRR